jgi:hypothetical protein
VIRLAIERGARRLSLGQSTWEAKMRFGARPRPLWIALQHRSALVSAALRAARGPLFPAPRLVEHHVFAARAEAPGAGSA